MNISDETLIAYVDGELDAATRAQIEAALATDPDLAQRLERHAALTAHIRNAFDAVLDEQVPKHLLDATASSQRDADVIDLAQRRDAKRVRPRAWSWPQWGAIAAAIVAGVTIGRYAAIDAPQFASDRGQVVARGTLAKALSSQLASAQTDAAAVKIGISFKTRADEYCRTFAIAKGPAGLACKQHGEWQVRVLAPPETSGEGAYRMAASAMPEAVMREVDKTIVGDPLDATQEAQLQRDGWQK